MRKEELEKHKTIYSLLQRLPGFLVWMLLLSPFWLGLIAPNILIYYVTFLTIYWSYTSGKLALGAIVGYQRYKKEMSINWSEKLNELKFENLPEKETRPEKLEDLKFFILVPIYSEQKEVLEDSFKAILSQTFPLKQVTFIYTCEEKYLERMKKQIDEIAFVHKEKFDDILFYVHPMGIEGEARGVASANRAWGAKHAVEDLIKKGENLRNFIFLNFDSDSVLDRQFLSRLAHLYLVSDRRDHKFYSTAVHLFNNNIWDVPMMMRIEANMVTLGSLSDWITSSPKVKDTFSCYAASLQTLIDQDYWDTTLENDDTMFYWRAFFTRNGDFEGVEHYIPYSADAVIADTFVNSHIAMYKQLLRWGWGAISMPISLTGFIVKKEIPFITKLMWIIKHLETRVMMITAVFLITFSVYLVSLINPNFKQSSYAYSVPDIMSTIMTITLFFIVPLTFFRLKLLIPMPKNWNIFKKILVYLEGPLIILNLFTYSLVPWIEAQTRMMFGKRQKDLFHTAKIKKV